jgi:hypothetical protein
MTNPMTTTADMIYSSSGSTPARLGIGTVGQVLTVNSGATAPEWAAIYKDMLTSYNGWPASKDPAEIGIKSYAVPGTKRTLRCAEAVAPLLIGFAAEFHALIEPIDEGKWDEWGYAFRDVRGVGQVK